MYTKHNVISQVIILAKLLLKVQPGLLGKHLVILYSYSRSSLKSRENSGSGET